MGEIVTGKMNEVRAVRVLLPRAMEVDDDFIAAYGAHVDVACLAPHAITLEMVQDSLRWFRNLPSIRLPQQCTYAVMQALCSELGSAAPKDIEAKPDAVYKDSVVKIAFDTSNFEATSTAMILKDLLVKLTYFRENMVPDLLRAAQQLRTEDGDIFFQRPDEGYIVFVVVCTNGVFFQKDILASLIAASEVNAVTLPILSDENFRFPNREFLESVRPIASLLSDDPDALLRQIEDVFREIAPVFQPQLYSSTEQLLQTKAKEIAARLFVLADGTTASPPLALTRTDSNDNFVTL